MKTKLQILPLKVSLQTKVVFVFVSSFVCFCFLGPHPWHLEVPRLGVESELQLLVYATATVTWELSHICDLHYSLWQRWILNPLSKAGDQTPTLTDTSWVHNLLSHSENSSKLYF